MSNYYQQSSYGRGRPPREDPDFPDASRDYRYEGKETLPAPAHHNTASYSSRPSQHSNRRSRSRSRSDSRERKQARHSNHHQYSEYSHHQQGDANYYPKGSSNNYPSSRGHFQPPKAEPALSVVLKGLPSHTTENTLYSVLAAFYPKDIRLITPRDSEVRAYAFVEFPSLEYSQYFMDTYAGSAGDMNAAQLIVENRAVSIEYARERTDRNEGRPRFDDNKGGRVIRSDWLCGSCNCHNFAKRDICFKCNLPRNEHAIPVAPGTDAFGDSLLISDVPTAFLVVRGFGAHVTEEQMTHLFRQYSVVKHVTIVKELPQGPHSRHAKAIAFVEFHSADHAAYALQCSADLKVDNFALKTSFAKEDMMQQIVQQSQTMVNRPAPTTTKTTNALVASALQAAQWSMNNNYAGAAAVPPSTAPPGSNAGPVPNRILPLPAKLLWPPNFDTNGAAYVFQPKTGYFLEVTTDFYYCPKSKMYYSGKDGIYYHFDPTLDPPFRRFDPPVPTEPEVVAPTENTELTTTTASIARQPVTVSIGFNKLKGKAPSTAGKKALLDIAKWGAIQKEDADEEASKEEEATAQQKVTPVTTTSSTSDEASTSNNVNANTDAVDPKAMTAPTTTVPAAPTSFVCLLCRRQFNSAEMLGRHEKESKLHAENLLKQKQTQAAATTQYRNRAEERRELFGSEPDHVRKPAAVSVNIKSTTSMVEATARNVPAVSVTQDTSNPGNQMLRKMGWTEGQGLGKDGQGKEVAVGLELADNKASTTAMHTTLKGTLGDKASGGQDKDSILAATRARFDQVSK